MQRPTLNHLIMKKILIFLPYIPYPLYNGGNNAVFSAIDQMRKDHKVSIALDIRLHGLKAGANTQKKVWMEELKRLWPDVTFYQYEGQKEYPETNFKQSLYCRILHYLKTSLARKYKRAYNNWAHKSKQGDPARANSLLPVSLPQYNPGFLRFAHEVAQKGFDIIQVEMYEYLFLGYILPQNVKRIFVHHEIRFVRQENEINLFKEKNFNDILRFEEAKAMEIAALKQYDHIVTLTQTDKDILSEYISVEKLTASPVNTTGTEIHATFRPCTDFVFIGNGGHYPNFDAMLWFANDILPILREMNANPVIHVVGNWKKQDRDIIVNGNPEIRFTGFVNDLSAFLNGKISIIPLRIGSGMRIKIQDAIQSNSPFITTSKGVEGLPFGHETECLIADSSKTFAHAMVSLQESTSQQEKLTANAISMFCSLYNPERLYKIRKGVYS